MHFVSRLTRQVWEVLVADGRGGVVEGDLPPVAQRPAGRAAGREEAVPTVVVAEPGPSDSRVATRGRDHLFGNQPTPFLHPNFGKFINF